MVAPSDMMDGRIEDVYKRQEYTLPNVSQTVILTRMEGRTPVPEKEEISKLASHQASMALFLSKMCIRDSSWIEQRPSKAWARSSNLLRRTIMQH